MGFGKPQLHAKFEVDCFIYYGNIRKFVLNDNFAFGLPLIEADIDTWKLFEHTSTLIVRFINLLYLAKVVLIWLGLASVSHLGNIFFILLVARLTVSLY